MPKIRSLIIQSILCLPLLVLNSLAQTAESIEKKVDNPIGSAAAELEGVRKSEPLRISLFKDVTPSDRVEFISDEQYGEDHGNIAILIGNVIITYQDIVIIADRAKYNKVTDDVLAEGNVYFEQQGQRVVGKKLDYNYRTKLGTLIGATAFTNRTPDGTTLMIDSANTIKTGIDSYRFSRVRLTACPDGTPKWSITASSARLRLDHRANIFNALFKVKGVPVFYLPFASISISKKDRQSGFLIPSSGSSTQKGRVVHQAYYQTLGRSADVLFRGDYYSDRGYGAGLDFRARTNESSYMYLGAFSVFDRGDPNNLVDGKKVKQGGTSFYADVLQHFKYGFVGVADINITSSLAFRQVFGENIATAISPEERSIVYLNKNWNSYSFNAFFGEQSTYMTPFDRDGKPAAEEIVKIRKLPSFELTQRDTQLWSKLPVYFSFDFAAEGVSRKEATTSGNNTFLKTPPVVQRLDVFPKFKIQVPSFAGFTLTPSVGARATYYSNSIDTTTVGDTAIQKLTVSNDDLTRKYLEVELDFRFPSFSKVFKNSEGTPKFKHIIEPYVTYRRIAGIDQYDSTLLIDERDAVADTNELVFGISNSILVRRKVGTAVDGTEETQPHELINFTVKQKYFFDPAFGGALVAGRRNQFFPIDTLSGFSYGGEKRSVSPLNLSTRIRPTTAFYGDVRLDYDTKYNRIRDVMLGYGYSKGLISLSQNWYFTKLIKTSEGKLDPSSYPGNQLDVNAILGNVSRGPFIGASMAYDFRDQKYDGTSRGDDFRPFINRTLTAGYAWDCCSFNVRNITYNAGLRNETRTIFAFTLKGIGSFGTENIGQKR